MSELIDALFRPLDMGKLKLPNRIVMAPMTRSFSPDGVPGKDVADYYARRAANQVGLIITEGVSVNRLPAANEPNIPNLHTEQALAGWANVVKGVHEHGGQIWPQLWHVGALRGPNREWAPPAPLESPSGLSRPGKTSGVALTETDIQACIDAYAEAAGNAYRLGFDGVEIHGAHGYLIDQFFWQGTNERTDSWSGETLSERTRFAAEVVRAVRAATSPDFPICIRLSQWKQQDFPARLAVTPDEMQAWLSPLVDAGVDVFHCSQRRFWEAEFEGADLNFAGWAKKLTGLPSITVGSVGLTGEFIATYQGEASAPAPLDDMLRRLARDEFDLVAVGRALLGDAEWASKIRSGKHNELASFDRSAMATLY